MRLDLVGAFLGFVITPLWETELLRLGHVFLYGSEQEFWGFVLWVPEALVGALIGILLGTLIDLGKLRRWAAIAIYMVLSLILPITEVLLYYLHGGR